MQHSPQGTGLSGMTSQMQSADELEITKLFEDGDRALMSADMGELQRIYAADYMQSDEHGNLSSRDDLIRNLRSGALRLRSMISTGRRVRLLREDVAVVHGSEQDEIERQGVRSTVRYLYMDVVMKREGRWQIVASQLVRLSTEKSRDSH